MEAAAKAAQDEARKKTTERNKKPAEKTVAAADSNPAAPAQAADGAAGSNTLFGGPHTGRTGRCNQTERR
jgi:hypothetical protein